MTKGHIEIAKAVRELPIDELCDVILEHQGDKSVAVMDRLGALISP